MSVHVRMCARMCPMFSSKKCTTKSKEEISKHETREIGKARYFPIDSAETDRYLYSHLRYNE
jgi:hypothetical protein